ncbi:MAG: thiamine phosphate synthase [Janthinobacterium lividum]
MPAQRDSRLYLITPEWHEDAAVAAASDPASNPAGRAADAAFAPFLARLERALSSGIDLVQLRAKALAPPRYRALAAAVREVCRAHHATLILNGPAMDGTDLNDVHAGATHAGPIRVAEDGRVAPGDSADGLHLSSARLMACRQRPIARPRLVSAACHTLAELRQAARIGADFVTLSPVLPTRSHPDAVPLGWERFAELTAASPVPVYALGGMTRAHLVTAQACGARGIAAISGLW